MTSKIQKYASRAYCIGIIFVIYQSICLAQVNTFVKLYNINPEFGDVALSLKSVGDKILFTAGSIITGPEEFHEDYLVRIDNFGDLNWSTILADENGIRYTNSTVNGLVIFGDSIILAGTTTNIPRSGTSVGHLAHVIASHETGGARYLSSTIDSDSATYSSANLHMTLDSLLLNISSIVTGEEAYYPATITVLTLAGEEVSRQVYFEDYRQVLVQSSVLDADENLYLTFWGCKGESCNLFQAWIAKIDREGNLLWVKNYGASSGTQRVTPTLALLSDNRLALSWTRDTNDLRLQESPPIVYILDSDGEKEDSIAFHGNWRTLHKIHTARNGDIIGVGYAWTDIGYCGWMIRVSAEAELVWERYVQDHRLSDIVITELVDVDECSDGSIVAVGSWQAFSDPIRDGGSGLRSWVVKLDADGRLDINRTSDTIHLMRPVSNYETQGIAQSEFQVSPNPVADVMHLELSGATSTLLGTSYKIINTSGRVLLSGVLRDGAVDIDVDLLPAGVYFALLSSNSRIDLLQHCKSASYEKVPQTGTSSYDLTVQVLIV